MGMGAWRGIEAWGGAATEGPQDAWRMDTSLGHPQPGKELEAGSFIGSWSRTLGCVEC